MEGKKKYEIHATLHKEKFKKKKKSNQEALDFYLKWKLFAKVKW